MSKIMIESMIRMLKKMDIVDYLDQSEYDDMSRFESIQELREVLDNAIEYFAEDPPANWRA